jgi:hypothetical protein
MWFQQIYVGLISCFFLKKILNLFLFFSFLPVVYLKYHPETIVDVQKLASVHLETYAQLYIDNWAPCLADAGKTFIAQQLCKR